MTEKMVKITKETLIPIGFVLSVLWMAYQYGGLATQVGINTDSLKNIPTRNEMTVLQQDVKDIKGDIKILLQQNNQ